MENLIEVSNVTFGYSAKGEGQLETPVIDDINLNINRGEFVTIVGPNGCGKSTLVRHLNALLLPTGGTVTVDGIDTRSEQNISLIRKKVGMVFQNPDNQLFASVVEEDVAFGVENLQLPRAEIRSRVDMALEQLGMLEYRYYPPHHLSGGQKQKVAIAGILAMQPQCIVLDEPTSMLDPKGKREVMEAVLDLNSRLNITVIYVTHDMNEVLYSHRVVALNSGKVIFSGSPGEFFATSELLDRMGLQAPSIKLLVKELKDSGVKIRGDINSSAELVDAIC